MKRQRRQRPDLRRGVARDVIAIRRALHRLELARPLGEEFEAVLARLVLADAVALLAAIAGDEQDPETAGPGLVQRVLNTRVSA
jgi:hypothetical protein